jgi:hypothetical protein
MVAMIDGSPGLGAVSQNSGAIFRICPRILHFFEFWQHFAAELQKLASFSLL